jgi:hypothetical protein
MLKLSLGPIKFAQALDIANKIFNIVQSQSLGLTFTFFRERPNAFH